MIHDVARLARHSHARETALAALCRSLADRADSADATSTLLAIADNCAARAELWTQREPDAAYVAVGRPGPDTDPEPDAVLDTLSRAAHDPMIGAHAAAAALSDMLDAYRAQRDATDDRLDGPTARVLDSCRAGVSADVAALAAMG